LSLLTIVVPFTAAKVILSFICSATYADFFFVSSKKKIAKLAMLRRDQWKKNSVGRSKNSVGHNKNSVGRDASSYGSRENF
jgi:hypothetical protein